MRVLGIDPGTARLGYAVLETVPSLKLITCGIIKTSKDQSASLRLAEIRKDLLQIINLYKPELVSVEKLFFFKNLKTIVPVAEARGVILEVAGTLSLELQEFTPLQVKQIITGQGRAEKSLVADIICSELGLSAGISPDDASDAVAIALCSIRNRKNCDSKASLKC